MRFGGLRKWCYCKRIGVYFAFEKWTPPVVDPGVVFTTILPPAVLPENTAVHKMLSVSGSKVFLGRACVSHASC